MKGLIHKVLSRFYEPLRVRLDGLSKQSDRNAVLMGQLLAQGFSVEETRERITSYEFKVFSQFGEDGIIQYLISRVPIINPVFVELGVEDYYESNTRFLLTGKKWAGLVVESDADCVEKIKRQKIYWQSRLKAASAFITRENINRILTEAGIEGDIGLFSLDLDGNEYWIWQALEVVHPRIVVCEFNLRFGFEHAITIPYRPDFEVRRAHPSRFYHGASLPALCLLAEQKGYDFVGCTSERVNAFFVRKDVSHGLAKLTARDGFEVTKTGGRRFDKYLDDWRQVAGLPVVNVETGSVGTLEESLSSNG